MLADSREMKMYIKTFKLKKSRLHMNSLAESFYSLQLESIG